jgi:hypothetical protein
MKFKIQNKTKFVMFALNAGMIILIICGAFYYLLTTKKSNFSYIQKEFDSTVDAESGDIGEGNLKEEVVVPLPLLEYTNKKYDYLVKYPNNWYVNTSDSESDLVKADPKNETAFGGQTFWSNYANIEDYNPENKPKDFRLLGLTVYQGGDVSMDDFAKKISIVESATKVDFETENKLAGVQFISTGLTEQDLSVTVVLKKNKLFYVFETAFIDGDLKAAVIMESIVKSFI